MYFFPIFLHNVVCQFKKIEHFKILWHFWAGLWKPNRVTLTLYPTTMGRFWRFGSVRSVPSDACFIKFNFVTFWHGHCPMFGPDCSQDDSLPSIEPTLWQLHWRSGTKYPKLKIAVSNYFCTWLGDFPKSTYNKLFW